VADSSSSPFASLIDVPILWPGAGGPKHRAEEIHIMVNQIPQRNEPNDPREIKEDRREDKRDDREDRREDKKDDKR
jgi:hypothetical protein